MHLRQVPLPGAAQISLRTRMDTKLAFARDSAKMLHHRWTGSGAAAAGPRAAQAAAEEVWQLADPAVEDQVWTSELSGSRPHVVAPTWADERIWAPQDPAVFHHRVLAEADLETGLVCRPDLEGGLR
mmetsp:Transcript_59330/g.129961  ORF Transcript_59330/g.129961 Transcript_59330/m.129961 type:complete len:127 (+) Transcript_59330:1023-1403(+)